ADAKRFERLAPHLAEVPAVEHVVLIDAEPSAFASFTDGVDAPPTLHGYRDAVRSGSAEGPGFPDTEIAESDPAVIFYTSGTTGRPKGAISTHGNMIANLQNTVFTLTLSAMANSAAAGATAGGQPVSLLTSPLFHVSGCHSTLVVGFMGG
ncbi:MAG: acyl--CoA ligase, partial [Microthrixaceae bacterium]|nr:acyl--CoA ligase [Microthrixaceae bacterium]